MADGKIGHRPVKHQAQIGFGNCGMGGTGISRRKDAREDLGRDHELVMAGHGARLFKEQLGIRFAGKLGRSALFDLRTFRQAGKSGIDDDVEHMRRAGDNVGKTRRAAEDLGEQPSDTRMVLQDRKQFDGRRHLAQSGIERRQRSIGIGRIAECFKQGRNKFCEDFARTGRGHGGATTEMPPADRIGDNGRPGKTQFSQRIKRRRIILDPGEHQRSGRRGQSRRGLEKSGIVPFDSQKPTGQRLFKSGAGIAAEPGEPVKVLVMGGQPLGLFIADHLDAVLDAAQEAIGFRQIDRSGLRNPAILAKRIEHRQRALAPQIGASSAVDELLGLDEELDLADAPTPDLHVMAKDGDGFMSFNRIDLPLHRMNIGNGSIIEVLAPNERRQILEKPLSGRNIAGDRAGLDHRRAFPVLPHGFVIGVGRIDRHNDRRRAWIRPEPEIDAVNVSVSIAILKEPDQRLDHPHGQFIGIARRLERRRFGIEKNGQIDVGGIIEFARAVLAECEHEHTQSIDRIVRILRGNLAIGDGVAKDEIEPTGDTGIGEFRQRRDHFVDTPDAAEIAECNQERRLGAQPAQPAHRIGFAVKRHGIARDGADASDVMLGRIGQQSGQSAGVANNETPEEVRPFLNTGEQVARTGRVAQNSSQIGSALIGMGHQKIDLLQSCPAELWPRDQPRNDRSFRRHLSRSCLLLHQRQG